MENKDGEAVDEVMSVIVRLLNKMCGWEKTIQYSNN